MFFTRFLGFGDLFGGVLLIGFFFSWLGRYYTTFSDLFGLATRYFAIGPYPINCNVRRRVFFVTVRALLLFRIFQRPCCE